MMLDVAVTTPTTPARAERAAFHAGEEAAKAERAKFDKYWKKAHPNRQVPPEGTRTAGLVPVALETGGLLGGEAVRWLQKVFQEGARAAAGILQRAELPARAQGRRDAVDGGRGARVER